jgi:hypothetical protein
VELSLQQIPAKLHRSPEANFSALGGMQAPLPGDCSWITKLSATVTLPGDDLSAMKIPPCPGFVGAVMYLVGFSRGVSDARIAELSNRRLPSGRRAVRDSA